MGWVGAYAWDNLMNAIATNGIVSMGALKIEHLTFLPYSAAMLSKTSSCKSNKGMA